jgi:hypothetical protein
MSVSNLTAWVRALGLTLCAAATSVAFGATRPPDAASTAATASTISAQKLAQIMPGMSTKAQVQSLLGVPWRVVQFNDCGEAMDHQSDEIWDYRGRDSKGTYRIHIEFDDHDVAHLVAKIWDKVADGKGTSAKIAPANSDVAMHM